MNNKLNERQSEQMTPPFGWEKKKQIHLNISWAFEIKSRNEMKQTNEK